MRSIGLLVIVLPNTKVISTSDRQTDGRTDRRRRRQQLIGWGFFFSKKKILKVNLFTNGARTLKIHQDGAALEHNRPTLATRGQPFMSRGTRGHKSTTTVYNQLQTTPLKIMQWNAEGLVKEKSELEHILKKKVLIYAAYKKPIFQLFL